MNFLHTILLLLLVVQQHGIVVESTGTMSLALSAFKSLDYRYFVAGGTCAAISHGITTPIDVIKTKIQAEPTKHTKGMLAATADIIKEDGALVLLGGLGPTVVGYGIEGSMKFGVYEVMKPIFKEIMNALTGESNTALAYLLASLVAGAVAATLLCPMEATRIKIVTDPAYNDKGLLPALTKMMKDDGVFSSFNGLWAMLSKQARTILPRRADVLLQIAMI